MKIRSDFITNSSSSAFVVIGAEIDTNIEEEDYEKMYELADENELYFFGEEGVIGKILANLDYDSGGPTLRANFHEIQALFEEVQNIFNKIGIKEEVKIIGDMFST